MIVLTKITHTEIFTFIIVLVFKDTHREKARSNYTPALTKNTDIDIWVIGTSN